MIEQHTQGPWEYGEDCDNEWYFAAASNPNVQLGWVCPNEESTQEANARLIAAAPELLEALKDLEAGYERLKDQGYPVSDCQKQARAAIAKARGEAT